MKKPLVTYRNGKIYTDSPIIYYGLVILASATGGFFAVYVGQPLALWLRSIILL